MIFCDGRGRGEEEWLNDIYDDMWSEEWYWNWKEEVLSNDTNDMIWKTFCEYTSEKNTWFIMWYVYIMIWWEIVW